MLTAAQLGIRAESPRIRRAHPLPSPKQRYQAYILQRIEAYKESLTRENVLKLGNDAAGELQAAPEGQYFLTEVLMQETVDRLIMRRLHLPTFSRWRQKHARLRQAQQSPTHWGIERRSAVAAVLPRLEAGDHAVVVGGGAESAVYLLAAHDVRVTCLFGDNATCTRIETRMAAESLTGDFEAFVVMLGTWFPTLDRPAHFVVIDATTLAEQATAGADGAAAGRHRSRRSPRGRPRQWSGGRRGVGVALSGLGAGAASPRRVPARHQATDASRNPALPSSAKPHFPGELGRFGVVARATDVSSPNREEAV